MAVFGYNQGNRKSNINEDWILADFKDLEEKKVPEVSQKDLWVQCEADFNEEWENYNFQVCWKCPIRTQVKCI